MIRGSCLCGDVGWESSGAFDLMSHCHCAMCRKSHGSVFATYVGTPSERFEWSRGRDSVVAYESSPGFQRPFCGRCGSPVPQDPNGERAFMAAGCLDDDPGARPVAHIFVASRAPWDEIEDELPRFDTYPPGFGAGEIALPTPPPVTEGRSEGSCLCGAVAYAVEGAHPLMIHCHCTRCRKARGAAHGTNLLAPFAAFHWLRGQDQVRSYKVPDAEFFTTNFCGDCGSSLPGAFESRDRAIIPVGTLDHDPGGRPRIHIFVGSMAPWHTITDALPQFEEKPPGA